MRERAFETRAWFRVGAEEHRRQHRTGSRTVGNCFGSLFETGCFLPARASCYSVFTEAWRENVCAKGSFTESETSKCCEERER